MSDSRLQVIIKDPAKLRFPVHGWAVNPQGVKLLWFPIKQLIGDIYAIRRAHGLSDTITIGKPRSTKNEQTFYAFPDNPKENVGSDILVKLVPGPLSPVPFYGSLSEVAILLKELHRFNRLQQVIPDFPETAEQQEFLMNMDQLAPMYIKWLYIEFKRLIDLFALHIGRTLFEKIEGLPNTFLEFKELVKNERKRSIQKPMADMDKIQLILSNTSPWFDIIRDPGGNHKGVRDALSHLNLRILFGRQRTNDQPCQLSAHLSMRPDLDLIATIPMITAGICKLFTDLCTVVEWENIGYRRSDYLPLWGNDDDDITGFWPKI